MSSEKPFVCGTTVPEKEMESAFGFHWGFVTDDPKKVIRQQDGAEVSAEAGAVEEYDEPALPALCIIGLHASESLYDSLSYADGCYLRYTEILAPKGELVKGEDKMVGRKRITIWGLDLTEAVLDRAREQAAYGLTVADIAEKVVNGTATPEETKSIAPETVRANMKAIALTHLVKAIIKAGYTVEKL